MNETYPSHSSKHPRPADAALAFLADNPVRAAVAIRYSSSGRLLVIGKPQAISAIAEVLPANIEVTAAIEGICPPELADRLGGKNIRPRDGLAGIDVFGWLGSFKFTATASDGNEDTESGAAFCEGGFDLVLDLLEPHIARRPSPPIGYLTSPWSEPDKLKEALAQLSQWVGEFEKPNYLRFDPETCDHRGGGIETCRRCYDVCGTWAITIDEARIEFNPYLCQGCGDCATVCPTGAITYNFPATQLTLARIEQMLQIYLSHGGKVPVLLLHDSTKGRAWLEKHRDRLPINVLPYEIEGLGSAGGETWLMALALGANEVLLLDSGAMNPRTRALLHSQLEWCRAILEGLGYQPEVLRMVGTGDMKLAAIPVHSFRPMAPLAAWTANGDKRTLLHEAVEHLAQRGSAAPFIPLPAGAPFGSVEVDTAACVLCMNCVQVCPEAALRRDSEGRELSFVEASCIQCGGCATICPEHAVSLRPRYTYDRAAAMAARPLARK